MVPVLSPGIFGCFAWSLKTAKYVQSSRCFFEKKQGLVTIVALNFRLVLRLDCDRWRFLAIWLSLLSVIAWRILAVYRWLCCLDFDWYIKFLQRLGHKDNLRLVVRFFRCSALLGLKNLPSITGMNSFVLSTRGEGPVMSTTANFNGTTCSNRRSWRCLFSMQRLPEHLV